MIVSFASRSAGVRLRAALPAFERRLHVVQPQPSCDLHRSWQLDATTDQRQNVSASASQQFACLVLLTD